MFHLIKTLNRITIRHEESFTSAKEAVKSGKTLMQEGYYVTLKHGTDKKPLLIFDGKKKFSENT